MKQHYDQYTPEDHTIWNILFDRQIQNLQGKSCQAYLDCVDRLSPEMAPSQVPDFLARSNAACKPKQVGASKWSRG